MRAPLQRIGGAASISCSASLSASLAMPASRWCSSSRISTLLGGPHLLLRRPRVCRQPFAAASLFSTAARAPAGATPPRGEARTARKSGPRQWRCSRWSSASSRGSGSASPLHPRLGHRHRADRPSPGAKFDEEVDELVAKLKRTHQFDRSAVSAVLPLLARTRQWETAVELVELMPRHGHVPLFLPNLSFPLFFSLLARSLAWW